MQELRIRQPLTTDEITGRTVTIFFHPNFFVLTGKWDWSLHTDAVFCSDTMLSFPTGFEGTKGIVHPEDVPLLKKQLFKEDKPFRLQFRIITSYGEIKNIAGEQITIQETKPAEDAVQEYLHGQAAEVLQLQKEVDRLQLVNEIYERADRYNNSGIWWYNETTYETWYAPESVPHI